MAAGDLITRDGQYEFNGILFNDALTTGDTVRVTRVTGLFDLPDLKATEYDVADDHGGNVGNQLFSMRRVVMEFTVLATSKANMQNRTRQIRAALQPSNLNRSFVYQRAGIGKLFLPVRVGKFAGFDSDWTKELGQSPATALFIAPDPRNLAFVQSSQTITIPASAASNSNTVTTAGDFVGGAKPILEIAGPVTNPRISNAGDGGRTIRMDLVISAGQTLILDFNTRSVTLGGVDQSGTVRTDNQWWVLAPGANLITFTRSNTPSTAAAMTVKWWNSYA